MIITETVLNFGAHHFSGCEFNGQSIQHGTVSPMQLYNIKGCVQCACFHGRMQCKSSGVLFPGENNAGTTVGRKASVFQYSCMDAEDCKLLSRIDDVKECKQFNSAFFRNTQLLSLFIPLHMKESLATTIVCAFKRLKI